MLKVQYCHYCEEKTLHTLSGEDEVCHSCVTRGMEEETKYLEKMREAQGLDLSDPDDEC